MSLDVTLSGKSKLVKCECYNCGNEHTYEKVEELYSSNITHNLGKMAKEAGIYEALWRPEEIGITTAKELIGKLGLGLDVLKADRQHFEKFNAPNGWGMYEHFVPFVQEYLNACIEYPDATVSVSR